MQEFRIGQRVRSSDGQPPYMIRAIFYSSSSGHLVYGAGYNFGGYPAYMLALAPELRPYVPGERLVMYRDDKNMRSTAALGEMYRCETDTEMATRHATELAAHNKETTQ